MVLKNPFNLSELPDDVSDVLLIYIDNYILHLLRARVHVIEITPPAQCFLDRNFKKIKIQSTFVKRTDRYFHGPSCISLDLMGVGGGRKDNLEVGCKEILYSRYVCAIFGLPNYSKNVSSLHLC